MKMKLKDIVPLSRHKKRPKLREIRIKEPNADLIDQLEGQLIRAKTGDLVGIIGVVVYNDGTTSEFWTPAPKVYHVHLVSDRIVGCLERIKFQLLSRRYGVDAADTWNPEAS